MWNGLTSTNFWNKPILFLSTPPLTEETTNLFGQEAFIRMKPEALLINTARGPLVDIDALAQALEAGEIAGAALDCVATGTTSGRLSPVWTR